LELEDDHWEILSRQGSDWLWGDLFDPAETRLRETLEAIDALLEAEDLEPIVERALERAAEALVELLERERSRIETRLRVSALELLDRLAAELRDQQLTERLRRLRSAEGVDSGLLEA